MAAAPQVADTPIRTGVLYTRTRRHRIRYPKNYDPNSTVKPVPDPHRWLPKSQRPGQSRKQRANIRGPQGLVSVGESKVSTGPSTAHIQTTAAPTSTSSGKKKSGSK
jgi:hypothetical protein